MASGRRGAGDRVLEGKHVIGLFLLMLLFSGVFFSLGYVMGRNQYDGQVRAATTNSRTMEPAYVPKDPVAKRSVQSGDSDTENDPATSDKPGWEFPNTATPPKSEPHLVPAPKAAVAVPPSKTLNAKANVQPPGATPRNSRAVSNSPLVPSGSFLLQVVALTKQDDALAVASSLQKKHFAAYVSPPQKDKFYRVQVGPFKDEKSAEAAKKGLESAGYKAFFVKH